VGLVIVLVFAKIVATAGAISSSFIGGPIFPLLFSSGAAGAAVHLIFPTIPLALSVACTMAALTAAALPAPFMITIVVLLVAGTPATESIPVILAAVIAHVLTFGLGFLSRPGTERHQAAQHAQEAATGSGT
jgi:H+/Cl- antiporter ClcA